MPPAVMSYYQQPPPPQNVQPPPPQYPPPQHQPPYQYPPPYYYPPPPKRRSPLLIVVLLLLVALVGGVAALVLIGGYNLDDLELRLRGKTYEARSFTVRYPKDWSPVQTANPDVATFATTEELGRQVESGQPVTDLDQGEAVVSVATGSAAADPQLASQPAAQALTAAQLEVQSVEEKEIGPHEATETLFTVTTATGAHLDGVAVVVVVDDTPFVVQGLAAEGEIDDYQGMIEAMIRSLEVDESPGSSAPSASSPGGGETGGSSGASGPDDDELIAVVHRWISALNARDTQAVLNLMEFTPDTRDTMQREIEGWYEDDPRITFVNAAAGYSTSPQFPGVLFTVVYVEWRCTNGCVDSYMRIEMAFMQSADQTWKIVEALRIKEAPLSNDQEW